MIDFEKLKGYFPLILNAVLILIIGHFIIAYIVKIIKRACMKANSDTSFISFVSKTVNIILHMIVVLSALNTLGISTTGLVAAFSAAVVAVGLALKDSLGNIAGGVLLLVSPRFLTGDFIEASGDSGTVVKVDLLHTTIRTVDNRQISIPNGLLINSHIINYSGEEKRRVDIKFSISYDADVNLAKQIIKDTILSHPAVLNEPEEPLVRVLEYSSSSVEIITRTWCNSGDYWTLYFDLMEQVRLHLEEKDITIPYNQLDVHIKKEE